MQWWVFVFASRLGLLDVLRQRLAGRYWALARDAKGDKVMNRWA